MPGASASGGWARLPSLAGAFRRGPDRVEIHSDQCSHHVPACSVACPRHSSGGRSGSGPVQYRDFAYPGGATSVWMCPELVSTNVLCPPSSRAEA